MKKIIIPLLVIMTVIAGCKTSQSQKKIESKQD